MAVVLILSETAIKEAVEWSGVLWVLQKLAKLNVNGVSVRLGCDWDGVRER
jgi:hypothetical protein